MILREGLTAGQANTLLLLEGFVSVSLQMIALRQIVPFVGSSVPVTSIVITGFLVALALGYRAGGRHSGGLIIRLERNLLIVAGLIGLALSYVVAGLLFETAFHLVRYPLIAVTLYVVLLLMPVVYLLSETVVLLVHFKQGSHAAQQAGDTFTLSTWGNVAGGLITTLVIMYFFGIGWAVLINTAAILLAFMILPSARRVRKSLAAVSVLLLALVVNVGFEQYSFFATTAYANYRTVEMSDGSHILDINNSNASRAAENGEGHPYIEYFESLLFDGESALRPESILVLGAGGFTFGRGRDMGNTRIEYVDVDATLEEVALELPAINDVNGQFVVADARAHLLATNATYDAILVDTFSHATSVPAHLLTVEFFELVRERLAPNGSLMINVIAKKGQPSRFRRGFDNTVRTVFADCQQHEISRALISVSNVLYTCTRSDTDEYQVVYSDQNTRGSVDSAVR